MMRSEDGSVTATVIVFPTLLLLVLLVVQFALAYHARNVVTAAAQDAARAAEHAQGDVTAGRQAGNAVIDDDARHLLDNVTVDVSSPDGTTVAVTVAGDVATLMPIPGFHPHVTGHAGGPIEQFRPEHREP